MKIWRIGLIFLALGVVFASSYFFQAQRNVNQPVVINQTAVAPLPTLNPDLVTQGQGIYAQSCATCHGANLEGAMNWKQPLPDGAMPPPPHDTSGHTWHHPDSLLINIILNGGDPTYNSKMPAFKGKLTDEEINAVLEFIKSKWGQQEREYQWWMTKTDAPQ